MPAESAPITAKRRSRAHVPQARVMIMLGSPNYFAPSCAVLGLEIEPALVDWRRGELDILWLRVHGLARALADRGLSTWVDEEPLHPGLLWQPSLEQGIRDSAAVAVCIAADGLGP